MIEPPPIVEHNEFVKVTFNLVNGQTVYKFFRDYIDWTLYRDYYSEKLKNKDLVDTYSVNFISFENVERFY